jgi:NitT/TauT family transport system substrate-binding protein
VSIQSLSRISVIVVALLAASIGVVHAQAPQRVVFATDWLAQAEHGGFYQAVAEGTYAKYGLDVQIRMGGPQVNGLQLLAAGQLDVAMADALQVMSAIEQDVPVVAIAATFQKNPTVLIAHPGANRLEDLKGKPVAIAAAANTTVLAVAATKIRIHRQPEASVRVFRAAVPGRSQAVTAGIRHVRALLDREGWRAARGVPAGRLRLSALFRGARRHAHDARRPQGNARAIPPRVGEGWRSYLANPAPGNALIKQANPQMSDELIAYGVRKMSEYGIVASGDARKFGLLTMTDGRWQATIDFLRSVGLAKNGVDYKRAYTLDLVKAVRVVP